MLQVGWQSVCRICLCILVAMSLSACGTFQSNQIHGHPSSFNTMRRELLPTKTDPILPPSVVEYTIPKLSMLASIPDPQLEASYKWVTQAPSRIELLLWLLVFVSWKTLSRRWLAYSASRKVQKELDDLRYKSQLSIAKQQHFHAVLAHELRGPVTQIGLQTSQLEALPLTSRAQVHLRHMNRGISRVKELLEKLLTLSQLQSQPALVQKAQDRSTVQNALRESLADLMPHIRQRDQDVYMKNGTDACVLISEFDLHTLLRNLLENAVRYSPIGGAIEISLNESREKACIQITDNGPGIPDEHLDRVFEPFFRLQKVRGEGSGLGLAIVRTIVLRWGGEVFLQNRSEGGLIATACLPLAQGTANMKSRPQGLRTPA